MNKIVIAIAALAALAFVGCASVPTAAEMMAEAKNKAPDGVLVVMGTGNDAIGAAREVKNQYIRAVSNMIRNMAQDAAASGEIPASAASNIVQPVTGALTVSNMTGATKVDSGVGKGSTYWNVSYMEKSDVLRQVNLALAAAKESVPEAAPLKVDSRFDAEYTKAINREWKN